MGYERASTVRRTGWGCNASGDRRARRLSIAAADGAEHVPIAFETGPARISFAADSVVEILCFSLGGFARQMPSSMMR
jgi:hypothetical protein